MRVALYSSKRPRCGIATYSFYLEAALKKVGADVRHWGSSAPPEQTFSEIRTWNPEVFHIQHERAIMPPDNVLASFTSERSSKRRKNIITLHTETPASVELSRGNGIHAVVIHRLPELLSDAYVLPMPCPALKEPAQRSDLRKRYGFPEDAFVVSTLGFMLPWKMTSEIAGYLLPWLKVRTHVHLQVIASQHFAPDPAGYMKKCSQALASMSADVGGRIKHISHYPSDQEVLDRLLLSDLGYAYCPFNTASASAAASMFVSARCPLVTSTSTHYEHLMCHVVRAPKEDPDLFTREIVHTANDPDLLLRLRESNEFLYAEANYLECAKKHMEIYGAA